MLKIMDLEKNIRTTKELAENKLAKHENADEFVEIGDADGFKIYVTAGKTLEDKSKFFMKTLGMFSCWCFKEKYCSALTMEKEQS